MKPFMIVGTSAAHRQSFAQEHFGAEFELVFISPDIDEKQTRSDDAFALTKAIACEKLKAVLQQVAASDALQEQLQLRSQSVAITFDQVVVWENQIREKPESYEENKRFLMSYSNSSVGTVQCTALYCFESAKTFTRHNTTLTRYTTVPEDMIERTIARGVSCHTAGGFVVEDDEMATKIIEISSGTVEEVQGFSVDSVCQLLHEARQAA